MFSRCEGIARYAFFDYTEACNILQHPQDIILRDVMVSFAILFIYLQRFYYFIHVGFQ